MIEEFTLYNASKAKLMEGLDSLLTTRNRPFNKENLLYINDLLLLKGVDRETRSMILGTIIEESGGDPYSTSSSGKYYGLCLWSEERMKRDSFSDPKREIRRQVDYLLSSLYDTTNSMNWTHGGKGSGYLSAKSAYSSFTNTSNPLEERYRAMSFGYIRPGGKEDSYKNRLRVVLQLIPLLDETPIRAKEEWKIFKTGGTMNYLEVMKRGSGIHIKKKNRGKFTEYCNGKVTQECIERGKHSSDPKIRKRATFAQNARRWKHLEGGIINYLEVYD